MSNVVLDSGVFIASVFPETLTPQAKQFIKQLQTNNVILHAPALLRYEVVAVSRKAVYQGRVTAEEGLRARERLLSYPVTLHFDDNLLKRGYELATEYNRPTAYDSQYLAVAEQLSCDFWTADERMFNAVRLRFSSIRWLGNFKVEA
ncbi:MAG: type II toxin-antitoxin system VapC family toxin [Anaerolineaceae bacterium]|nr:type II toxin-antitoxin system VapC family toxin [Anaerolineaceae bacterium]